MSNHQNARPQPVWSDVEETLINLEKLHLLCVDEKDLKREGYVTAQLTSKALMSKLRCQNCGVKMRPPRIATTEREDEHEACNVGLAVDGEQNQGTSRRGVCEFHPGRVINLHFTCCEAHVSMQKGCHNNPKHLAPANYEDILKHNWTYYHTPTSAVPMPSVPAPVRDGRRRGRYRNVNLAPNLARQAIALDCEFGVSVMNETELIRMTAIDFFTKQILIDTLVKPDVIIKNYSTRYSGVTSSDMRQAVRDRTCIFGRDAARAKLLEFVHQDTILVMHGGSSDMLTLRWIHPWIIDTCILETYSDPLPGGRSLKNVCERRLGIEIQRGRNGHDSHEDALACRELVIGMMNLIPDD